ncbi:MAG: hypothetical protein ACLTDX_22895 [[Clostridium] innocuum]
MSCASPRALNDCLQQLQQELDLTVALVVKQETRLRQLEINLAQQQRDHEHAQKEEQQAKQALQAAEISWQAVAQNRIQEEEMQGLKQEDLQKREQQLQRICAEKGTAENKDTGSSTALCCDCRTESGGIAGTAGAADAGGGAAAIQACGYYDA